MRPRQKWDVDGMAHFHCQVPIPWALHFAAFAFCFPLHSHLVVANLCFDGANEHNLCAPLPSLGGILLAVEW